MSKSRSYPPAGDHGDIKEIFDDIFLVTGSMTIPGRLPMRFSRNMTIIRNNGMLTLINTVRLSEEGLKALEALGNVEHIIRIAGFHGVDDPFYHDRYKATLHSIDAPYRRGFGGQSEPYHQPDKVITEDSNIPVKGARLILIKSATPTEGLLLLDRDGGIVLAGDCFQNWASTDRFFSLPSKLIMRMLGFIKPHNVGPGWLRAANPDKAELKKLLQLDFTHLLPAHGAPVIGDAKAKYAPAINRL